MSLQSIHVKKKNISFLKTASSTNYIIFINLVEILDMTINEINDSQPIEIVCDVKQPLEFKPNQKNKIIMDPKLIDSLDIGLTWNINVPPKFARNQIENYIDLKINLSSL